LRKLSTCVVVLACLFAFLPSLCFGQTERALVSTNADLSTPAIPEPATIARPSDSEGSRVGVGVKISTLGIGGEVAVRLADRLNVRGGVSGFGLSHNLSSDGINYAGHVKLISGDAHLDVFLFRSFHVSPGLLFYNGNGVNANASVPGGQTFSVGGTQYESSTADPVMGTGKVTFTKVAPEITIGTGNLVPRGYRHWSINTEFGFAYTGAAKVALALTGSACQPPFSSGPACQSASSGTVAAQVQAQQTKFNSEASSHAYYKFWPVLSVGFGYSF
jgi:hypothetical protein